MHLLCQKSERKNRRQDGDENTFYWPKGPVMNRAVTFAKPLIQTPREAEFYFGIITLRLQFRENFHLFRPLNRPRKI